MYESKHKPQQDGPDLQRRTPLILQNVQTNAAKLVDVRMIDLRQEAHLGGDMHKSSSLNQAGSIDRTQLKSHNKLCSRWVKWYA